MLLDEPGLEILEDWPTQDELRDLIKEILNEEI